MEKIDIENKIANIFDDLGLLEQEGDLKLIDSEQIDSIQLVSIIIELEESFGIEIPDEYLTPDFSFHLIMLYL